MASSRSWINRTRRAVRAFFRADGPKRKLAFEAATELTRARVATLRSARVYSRHFGETADGDQPISPDQEADAVAIGRMVERVARVVPFRAVCLQQAIATKRMLKRRHIDASINFGLKAPRFHDETDGSPRPAHAWVIAGETVVNGDVDLDQYVLVGRFR